MSTLQLQRHFSFKMWLAILGLGVLAPTLMGIAFVYQQTPPTTTPPQDYSAVVAVSQATGTPVKLSIPSIKVNATIIQVGLAKDGSVGTPAGPYNTAWYKLGPKPGEMGSAVITGHYGPWKNGAQSVFNNLHKLKVGDTILVTDGQGKTISFTVTGSKVYNANQLAPEVFTKNDAAYLNLITCNGEWLAGQKTYTNRLVVFAKRTN